MIQHKFCNVLLPVANRYKVNLYTPSLVQLSDLNSMYKKTSTSRQCQLAAPGYADKVQLIPLHANTSSAN